MMEYRFYAVVKLEPKGVVEVQGDTIHEVLEKIESYRRAGKTVAALCIYDQETMEGRKLAQASRRVSSLVEKARSLALGVGSTR